MNIEFVEFYPNPFKKQKKKNILGTVHIYLIDLEIDIRGISVFKNGKGFFFRFPHYMGIDEDTKQSIFYPVFHFTSEEKQNKLMSFMHTTVKNILNERLGVKAK